LAGSPPKRHLVPGKLRSPEAPKIGRPSQAEVESRRIEEILDRVSAGETLQKVCDEIGGITPTQFRRWARASKENRELWADARREYAHSLFDKLADLTERLATGEFSKEENAQVTALKTAIDGLKHITARLNPDDYAERRDNKSGVSVTIVSSLPLGPGSKPEAAIDTAFRVVGTLPPPPEGDG
jgi:hypothetical protein